MMKHAILILIFGFIVSDAHAQLISTKGRIVEVATDIPKSLQGVKSLTFDDLSVVFDGGSQAAEFKRNDGKKLVLFFPHYRYWTSAAIDERVQPIALLTRREGKQVFVEITPGSKLNKRVCQWLDADVASGRHGAKKLAKLKRIRESVRKRSLLKEIEDRMPAAPDER